MKKNKKILIISLIIILVALVIALVYAISLTQKKYTANKKISSGNVSIAKVQLKIEDKVSGQLSDKLESWAPGEANLLTWNVKNTGTAAIFTRNTLKVYWNDNDSELEDLIYLYPANMTNEEILQDFNGEKEYALDVERDGIEIEEVEKIGISYMFYGDTLDGTVSTGVAEEVSYDNASFETDLYTTVEEEETSDKVGFKIFLSPEINYLMQGKGLKIEVVTEVMQYTEGQEENWVVESIENLE